MQQDSNGCSEPWDLIVIGSGIYGIQAARTYLELYPGKHVVLFEAGRTVGGVWSRERVYDDFWTQTPVGILGFSDQSIHEIPKNDLSYGFFKAKHVTEYLEAYCSNHVYNGRSLASRIEFGTSITSIKKFDGLWHVEATDDKEHNTQTTSLQIVDASGLTSQPNWPDIRGREHFTGKILHHKDLAKWERESRSERNLRVVVLGGAKSAADVAYSCAKAGHQVTWIIRRSGAGPAAFVSSHGSLGYKNSNEAFYTRFTSLFLCSLFSFGTGYDGILGWLQSTSTGQTLIKRVWRHLNDKTLKEANYDRVDGMGNGFQNLKPDTELFWQNDSTGINQRPDFFDIIAREVRVIREDISHMSEDCILLKDGTDVAADVVICATGWKIQHPYFDDATAARLGLPVDTSVADSYTEAYWAELLDHAAEEVHRILPILGSVWARQATRKGEHSTNQLTPFRLWKCVVPLHDPSIVFVGKLMLGNHFRNAEVQTLFACAVLSGKLELPSIQERERDVARVIAWCRKRYPGGKGRTAHWLYWDMVPYTDMLLAELKLRSHIYRKFWKYLFRPCFAVDLKGLVGELRANLIDK